MTPAQEWAMKRNWLRLRIKGIRSVCAEVNHEILTKEEQNILYDIDNKAVLLLLTWDNFNSKQEFLMKRNIIPKRREIK